MDVSFFESRVAWDVAEPSRMATSPCQDARSQESFVDHLRTEPPVATRDSEHDETPPVDMEEVPADERASTEDQEPEPVDETGAYNDAAAAASAQPASATQTQPDSATQTQPATGTQPDSATQTQPATGTQPDSAEQPQPATATGTQPDSTEQPQPASATDPQSPHSTQPSTAMAADIPPGASPGVDALKPEKLAAQAAAAPGVTQQRTGHPASAVAAAPVPSAVKRQATTATLPKVESAPVAVPGTGGVSAENDQVVVDSAAGSAEKPAGKTPGEKSGGKSRTTGTSGQHGESPTLSITKPDSVVRTLGELDPASRVVDALVEKPSSGVELADASPVTAGKEVNTPADASGRVQSFIERLPEQLFGRSSSGVQASREITQPDQMRLVQRVARAIEAAPQRGGLLRLRLRPPELGAVRLEVLLERGNLIARIETETQQARNVLLEHLPQLRDRLTAQGIHVEQFDVNVSSRDSSGTPFQSHDSENSPLPSLARRRAAAVSESSAEIHRTPDLSVFSSPGKLNVVI